MTVLTLVIDSQKYDMKYALMSYVYVRDLFTAVSCIQRIKHTGSHDLGVSPEMLIGVTSGIEFSCQSLS